MTRFSCRDAEVQAGAIALAEATDADRETYRRHVATCATCLRLNGGEREIERTMARVARARDAETWEPDIARAVRERMNAPTYWARISIATVGACAVVALSLHTFAGTGLANFTKNPLVVHYDGSRIVLERRSTEQQARTAAAPSPKMTYTVNHNVVYLSRAPQTAPKRVASAAAPASKMRTKDAPAAIANDDGVPVWRQGGGASISVAHVTRTVTQAAPPVASPQTLAIAPSYATREASPVGGETAINPQPTEIAYAQGANGTTVFEVLIDERGNPTKCTITKSSSYLSLDDAVCKAAMSVHYTPQTVNGRPQPGVYRDAFTFRDNGGGGGD